VIARLKIADLCGTARSTYVFSRTPRGNGGDCLVIGLDNDIFVLDFPQHTGKRGRIVLVAGPGCLRRTSRMSPSPLARISASGNDDLAKAGNAGQQENGQ
jgi:hypothetical protein